MSRVRAMVDVPAGRRTKWVVLVFWLIIVAVAGPLAGKLMGAEKNDASAWLPAQGRVDPGAGPAVAVPVAQRVPGRRGLRPAGRA